jgi:hypothetical protein
MTKEREKELTDILCVFLTSMVKDMDQDYFDGIGTLYELSEEDFNFLSGAITGVKVVPDVD